MSLEALKAELRRKTALEVQKQEAEAKQEAKRIKEEAREQIRLMLEKASQEALELVGRERMRIPAGRLRARRMLQDAKYALVSDVMSGISRLLARKTGNKREYKKLLEQLIREGQKAVGKADGTVIHVRKEDAQFAKKFGKVETIGCSGGAVVSSADGKLRIDNTFEALLEQKREELEQRAFSLIFGKGN